MRCNSSSPSSVLHSSLNSSPSEEESFLTRVHSIMLNTMQDPGYLRIVVIVFDIMKKKVLGFKIMTNKKKGNVFVDEKKKKEHF